MSTGGRAVRIFVSTTFEEMDAERECLHDRVLPELRRRGEREGIAIEMLDPRRDLLPGSAPVEAQRLRSTLSEVDACRPYFVGVLGSRYGRLLELPAEVVEADPWLAAHPGMSQVALEIARAALDPVDGGPFGTFYVRGAELLGEVPERLHARYLAESPEEAERLDALKRSLRATGLPVKDYRCAWDAAGDRIDGLDEFAEWVLEDLWRTIAARNGPAGVEAGGPAREAPFLDDGVELTVYRPRAVRPGEWQRLLAFTHLGELPADAPEGEPDPVEEVGRQAARVLGEQIGEYKATTEQSRLAVPRWGEVRLVPHLPGFLVNPPQQSFLWLESVHRAEFRIRAGPEMDGRVARGFLSAFLGDILMAEVALAIKVDSRPAASPDATERTTARAFRKIFASYSHKDRAIVDQFARYTAALGDTFLRDWTHLRAGECWSERLEELIREADVFQLFWSRNALASPFVEREWRLALSLGRPRFVRPCYWEDPLPTSSERGLPPPELRQLHFQRLAGLPLPTTQGDPPAEDRPPGGQESGGPRPGLRRAWAGARARIGEGIGRTLGTATGAAGSLFRRSRGPEARLDMLMEKRLDSWAVDREPTGPSSHSWTRRLLARAAPTLAKPWWPRTEEALARLRLELVRGGFRDAQAIQVYLGLKSMALLVALAVAVPLAYGLWGVTLAGVAGMAFAVGLGLCLPRVVLRWIRARRVRAIGRELPDALDLLFVYVEAGLGFDAAMRRASSELVKACPVLGEELTIATLQIQVGRTRKEVLLDLARRTGVEDVRGLAGILIEADRCGSSFAAALRDQSDLLRRKRRRAIGGEASQLAAFRRLRPTSRHERLRAQLPEAINRIACGLASGQAFFQSLRAAADVGPPIGTELANCLALMELGVPPEEALRKLAESGGAFEFQLLCEMLLTQRLTGGDLAALLDSLAEVVRARLGAEDSGAGMP